MSKSEERRKRLEALNRKPLPDEGTVAPGDDTGLRRRIRKSQLARRASGSAQRSSPPRSTSRAGPGPRPAGGMSSRAPAPIVFRRDLPAAGGPVRRESEATGSGPHIVLEAQVDGLEIATSRGGKAFLVERREAEGADELSGIAEGLGPLVADALSSRASPEKPDGGLRAELARSGVTCELRPQDLVFLDLETTGLGGSPLFLIGAMVWENQRPVVRQYFARDYSEEAAALELFLEMAKDKQLMVSFNGKSFDLPFVRMRAAYHGLACRLEMDHLDVLHSARRIWGRSMPDCKLQTLEKYVCGRWRDGDIPGRLIPEAYHAYVRTGNASQMVDVLKHNYLDLVTLAEIILRMPVH